MHIYGPAHVHGAQPINAPHGIRPTAPTETPASGAADEVQISDAASFIDKVHQLPDIRHDRVSEIQRAIAEGTYETDEKLEIALERMLDEF